MLLVNQDNIEEAANRIWSAFSSLGLEAALNAVDSLQPGDNGYLFKEELKEELRRKAGEGNPIEIAIHNVLIRNSDQIKKVGDLKET